MLMISIKDMERKLQHSHAYAMLKECLCRYGIEYSEETQLSHGKMGKPYLAERPDIHFNLSHADGIAACMVSEKECGIDCERVRPFRQNVVKRVFSESEKLMFETAPPEERDMLFFRLWTLKEAYVKAIGTGISFPMEKVSFSFDGEDIVCSVPDCSFRQYIVGGGRFVVAVCELD